MEFIIYFICAMIFAVLMIRRLAKQPNPISWDAIETTICIIMSIVWPVSVVVFLINQIFVAIHDYYSGDSI